MALPKRLISSPSDEMGRGFPAEDRARRASGLYPLRYRRRAAACRPETSSPSRTRRTLRSRGAQASRNPPAGERASAAARPIRRGPILRRGRERSPLPRRSASPQIHPCCVDRLPDSGRPLSRLYDQERLPVGRQVGSPRTVEPGEIALLRLAGCASHDHGAVVHPGEEDAPVPRDVVELKDARHPRDEAGPAVESHCMQRAGARSGGGFGRRKPDLLTVGGPGEVPPVLPTLREGFLLTGAVHDGDRPAGGSTFRLEEGDRAAIGGDARMHDPIGSLVDHFPDRKLDAAPHSLHAGCASDREVFSVGEKSANRTSSATSRGDPPASGRRASVPNLW